MFNSLHITPSIGNASFGLGQVAANLAKAQHDLKNNAMIWCLDTKEQVDWAISEHKLASDKIRGFNCNGFLRFGFSYSMLMAARSEGGNFDVIHQHGIWTACSCVTNKIRKKYNVPTIIAPHGSLQQYALLNSRYKKRIALMAYEEENLHQASCLHATAEAEINDFRDYGLSNPIALIPNGITDAWLESTGDSSRFREHYSVTPNRRILLFMSRITPKKGLPILIEAICAIRNRNKFSDWLLVITGADEFGHLKEVQDLIEKYKLKDSVLFTVPLYGQEKRDVFAAADAFVLPSFSEGAPMVVLDCLAAGVPVITTKGTPWRNLLTYKCGWWVDASVDGLTEALCSMIDLNPMQLKAMGMSGKALVRSQYLWSVQAQKTLDLYSWLHGRKPKPDFVICD